MLLWWATAKSRMPDPVWKLRTRRPVTFQMGHVPSLRRNRCWGSMGSNAKQTWSFQISIMKSSTPNGVAQSQASVRLEFVSLNMQNKHAPFRFQSWRVQLGRALCRPKLYFMNIFVLCASWLPICRISRTFLCCGCSPAHFNAVQHNVVWLTCLLPGHFVQNLKEWLFALV